jgi:coenzyme F420-0:L-glutamate ligase/coenzyme F420-1:gamma-L-glutamate ligase
MPDRDDLLASARVAHLATAGRGGRPHVVPVCFVWLTGALYTPLDLKPKRSADPRRLRRVRNLMENPRATVVVDRWDEDWSRLAYVLVEGQAALLDAGRERDDAEAALVAKYPQYRTLPLEGRPIIRIAGERVIRWP